MELRMPLCLMENAVWKNWRDEDMGEILIRMLGDEDAADINIKNEPFRLWGRMLPDYRDGQWSYSILQMEEAWDIFPDEHYNYEAMKEEHAFIGAYDGPDCVGLAILKHQWNRYLYLYDLKVNGAYRRRHIATRLMDAACRYAAESGYRGVWTIGQDHNLSACLFYIHSGFRIGGLDTEVYVGTKQEGNADIYFYKDVK